MNRKVRIVLIGNAEQEFKKLKELEQNIKEGKEFHPEMQLLKSIRQKIEFIRSNPFYGCNISKNKVPKEYHVHNLWRAELVQYWRMIYTIKGNEQEIICFITDILDHNIYNEKFGYHKK